jgi:hypothetical protein
MILRTAKKGCNEGGFDKCITEGKGVGDRGSDGKLVDKIGKPLSKRL